MPRQTPHSAKRLSPAKPRSKAHKIALVLGGGGLKGFAHIGVFKALKEDVNEYLQNCPVL